MASKVLEGYLKDKRIKNNISKFLYINPVSIKEAKLLTKENINKYEIITEDIVKSASSAIMRGIGGTLLLGGIGLLAGLSAKNKGKYVIAVEWKNEERSLIELDDIDYKVFIKSNF